MIEIPLSFNHGLEMGIMQIYLKSKSYYKLKLQEGSWKFWTILFPFGMKSYTTQSFLVQYTMSVYFFFPKKNIYLKICSLRLWLFAVFIESSPCVPLTSLTIVISVYTWNRIIIMRLDRVRLYEKLGDFVHIRL